VLGIGLGLCSSLAWGVSDFIAGTRSRRIGVLRVILISQTLGFLIVAVITAARGVGPPSLATLLPAIGGSLAGTAALGSFYRAMAIGSLSIVAPISATGVALPVIVGIAGGDRPAAVQLVGIAAATVGVVLASREHGPGVPDTTRANSRLTIGLSLVSAVGFGCYFIGIRSSARHDLMWTLFASRGAAAAMLWGAALAAGARVRVGRGHVPALAAVGILDLSATGLYALATRHGVFSEVAVASALYPLATVVLARIVLGERVRRIQELGVVAAIAGVALIAAG
jgi:drug/metabolite transporter (DMT)-like permease